MSSVKLVVVVVAAVCLFAMAVLVIAPIDYKGTVAGFILAGGLILIAGGLSLAAAWEKYGNEGLMLSAAGIFILALIGAAIAWEWGLILLF